MAILEHTLGIMIHPDREWKAIRNERHSFIQVFMSHVPILALIPTLCAFIGVSQVGWSFGGGSVTKLTVSSAIALCGITYFALLVGIYILGEFINWMSSTYGVRDDADKRHYEGTALAVYVSIPVLLAGFVNLYPDIYLNAAALCIAGAYSIYLIYEGIPILMNIPKERAFMYATSVVTVALVLAVVVRVGSVILWSLAISPVYIDG
jgi:hypothetical protein